MPRGPKSQLTQHIFPFVSRRASAHPVVVPVIPVSGLCMSYGGFLAVDSIDFDVNQGETFALLGPTSEIGA